MLFINVRKILTLPGSLRESCGAVVQGGLDFALNGASGGGGHDALRWTHYVSGGRNGPDDSDSTRLFNTARLLSTPAGALYGISLYSFLRILPPSYSARTRNQNAVFPASCVAPRYHPLLGWRKKKKVEKKNEGSSRRL